MTSVGNQPGGGSNAGSQKPWLPLPSWGFAHSVPGLHPMTGIRNPSQRSILRRRCNMAKQSAEVVTLQAPTTNKFIEAQDMLCEATYVAEFLRGTICNATELESGFELSAPEAYGF